MTEKMSSLYLFLLLNILLSGKVVIAWRNSIPSFPAYCSSLVPSSTITSDTSSVVFMQSLKPRCRHDRMVLRASQFDLSSTPEFQRELEQLRRRSTQELLAELKRCNIPLPIVADRNEVEHLLALHHVKTLIAQSSMMRNTRSKRSYKLALEKELRTVSVLEPQAVTYLLLQINALTGDIIPATCNEHERKVLLAKGLLRIQDRDVITYENLQKQIKQYSAPLQFNFENILTEGEELFENAKKGLKTTVEKLQHITKETVEGLAREYDSLTTKDELIVEIGDDEGDEEEYIQRREDELEDINSEKSVESIIFQSEIEQCEKELMKIKEFDDVVAWSKGKSREVIVALLQRKHVNINHVLNAADSTLINMLADAVMIENNLSYDKLDKKKFRSANPSQESDPDSFFNNPKIKDRKWRSTQTSSNINKAIRNKLTPEKDFLGHFFRVMVPNLIVGTANLIESASQQAGKVIIKSLSIAMDENSNHPLHQFESFLVKVTAAVMQALHWLAGWASSGRIKTSSVLLLCSFYAIVSRRGLGAFLKAMFGMKIFTIFVNSITTYQVNSRIPSNESSTTPSTNKDHGVSTQEHIAMNDNI